MLKAGGGEVEERRLAPLPLGGVKRQGWFDRCLGSRPGLIFLLTEPPNASSRALVLSAIAQRKSNTEKPVGAQGGRVLILRSQGPGWRPGNNSD